MEYYIYRDPDTELIHWGIKGMKWGVRRYQNKDGSLTPAGKKRVAAEKNALKERERSIKTREKERAERDKLNAKKAELDAREQALNGGKTKRKSKLAGLKKTVSDNDTSTRAKSISEMTNEELQAYTTRMQLEKNYYDAQRNLASVTPKQVSKGQKFVNAMMNDVVMPMAKDAGKKYMDTAIKKALGIKEEQKINWDDMIKKQTYLKNEADKVLQDLKRSNDINQEKDRAEARDKKRAESNDNSGNKSSGNSANNKSTPDSDNKSSGDSNSKTTGDSNTKTSSTPKSAKTEKDSSEKVYEGEIIGEGTSKAKSAESKQRSRNNTVIDADWSEVTVSSVPATVTNRGQSYISGLLEEPKGLARR